MSGLRSVLAAAAIATAVTAADPLFERASNKLERIENGQAQPGSVIVFTPAEINAWARGRVPQLVEGVRDPRVQLGTGTAAGTALVDFVKMRKGEGISANPLIAMFIEGERPVKVSVRVESGRGAATVYLTSVEISGVTASGRVLDFLVNQFFLPLFPDAKINRRFELSNNIDRIDVRPDGVRVTMKR